VEAPQNSSVRPPDPLRHPETLARANQKASTHVSPNPSCKPDSFCVCKDPKSSQTRKPLCVEAPKDSGVQPRNPSCSPQSPTTFTRASPKLFVQTRKLPRLRAPNSSRLRAPKSLCKPKMIRAHQPKTPRAAQKPLVQPRIPSCSPQSSRACKPNQLSCTPAPKSLRTRKPLCMEAPNNLRCSPETPRAAKKSLVEPRIPSCSPESPRAAHKALVRASPTGFHASKPPNLCRPESFRAWKPHGIHPRDPPDPLRHPETLAHANQKASARGSPCATQKDLVSASPKPSVSAKRTRKLCSRDTPTALAPATPRRSPPQAHVLQKAAVRHGLRRTPWLWQAVT